MTVHFLPFFAPALHVLPFLRPALTRWRSTESVPPSVRVTLSLSCAPGLSLAETAPSDWITGATVSACGVGCGVGVGCGSLPCGAGSAGGGGASVTTLLSG